MIRWEPLNHLLQTGLAELASRHWEESGNDKDAFAYDPDWARYWRMEASDILRWAALREKGELVGYASVIVANNLHDRTVCCAIVQDIFVAPEARKGGAANRLMDFLESQLAGIGVKHIAVAERDPAVGKWFSRKGYRSNERIWTKPLGSIH